MDTGARRRDPAWLPAGQVVDDYVFTEGPPDLDAGDGPREVRLSELFTAPGRR